MRWIALVVAVVMTAATAIILQVGLRGGNLQPLEAASCGHEPEAIEHTEFDERARAAAESVQTFRVTTRTTLTSGPHTWNSTSDAVSDKVSGRTYGAVAGWREPAGIYTDHAAKVRYRKPANGVWEVVPADDEPRWACRPKSEEFIDDGTSATQSIRVVYASLKPEVGDITIEYVFSRDAYLAVEKRSSWTASLDEGWEHPGEYEQVCYFSEVNVPVVFPADLPVVAAY